MRRPALALLLFALLAGSAAAATIHGSTRPERIHGTVRTDRIDVAFGGTDTVTCGRGNDLVVADRADRVARDCETVIRRISADTFRDPASQHESAVEPDDFAWGSTVVATFQLGRFEDGGSSGIGFAVSHDAGRTWRSGALPELGRSSDPAVAYDAAHGVWLISTLGVAGTVTVAVSRSTDGLSWSAPVQAAAGQLLDKEWIACDNGAASPFRGRCYLVYTDDELHRMVAQVSTDGGVTWSAPARISADLLGAQPEVRPDGSLVVLAVDLPTGNQGALLAFRSIDGGQTFGATTVANFTWHEPEGMRAVPLPSGAVGADGTVYAAWQACAAGGSCAANDIVLAQSPDGVTWSAPVAATHGGTDHFVTGIDADPARPGRVALVYSLFEPGSCALAGCKLGAALTTSSDGGTTWAAPRRLDVTPFAESWLPKAGGRMVGDYYSVAFAGERIVPVFALAEQPLGTRLREGIFATSLAG